MEIKGVRCEGELRMTAETRKVELEISGMHCASCATNVEKTLRQLDAVQDAQVNFGTNLAVVEFDTSKASVREIEEAIRSAGYQVVFETVKLNCKGRMRVVLRLQWLGWVLKG